MMDVCCCMYVSLRQYGMVQEGGNWNNWHCFLHAELGHVACLETTLPIFWEWYCIVQYLARDVGRYLCLYLLECYVGRSTWKDGSYVRALLTCPARKDVQDNWDFRSRNHYS